MMTTTKTKKIVSKNDQQPQTQNEENVMTNETIRTVDKVSSPDIKTYMSNLFKEYPELTDTEVKKLVDDAWKEVQAEKQTEFKAKALEFAKSLGLKISPDDVEKMFAKTVKKDTGTKGKDDQNAGTKPAGKGSGGSKVVWLDIGGGMPCTLAGPLPKEVKAVGGDRKNTPRIDPSDYHKIDPVVWKNTQERYPQIGDQPKAPEPDTAEVVTEVETENEHPAPVEQEHHD